MTRAHTDSQHTFGHTEYRHHAPTYTRTRTGTTHAQIAHRHPQHNKNKTRTQSKQKKLKNNKRILTSAHAGIQLTRACRAYLCRAYLDSTHAHHTSHIRTHARGLKHAPIMRTETVVTK